MLIKRYIGFVMRGRKEAMLMALLWAFVPLMGWLSTATMALVTLRKGTTEGALVALVCALPSVVFLIFGAKLSGFAFLNIIETILGVLLVWILATVLRDKANWTSVLFVGIFIGIVGVLLAHGFIGDLAVTWKNLMHANYDKVQKFLGLQVTANELASIIDKIAKVFTGFLAASIVFSAIFVLIIGRAMQAAFYNPGGFGKEFYQIRLGFVANTLLLVTLVAIYLGIDIAWDILPLVLILFFVAGLSLFHAVVARSKTMLILIIAFYALLILFFQFIGPLVVIFAIMDTWVDFRSLVLRQQKKER